MRESESEHLGIIDSKIFIIDSGGYCQEIFGCQKTFLMLRTNITLPFLRLLYIKFFRAASGAENSLLWNKYKMNNSRLVYSTETGKICPSCHKPVSKCTCKKKKSKPPTNVKSDGIIRIQREVKGRKGKTVTTVSGFQLNDDELKRLATELKRRCGTGGSMKDGVIIIQGDHRDVLIAELKNRGFTAKIAGG